MVLLRIELVFQQLVKIESFCKGRTGRCYAETRPSGEALRGILDENFGNSLSSQVVILRQRGSPAPSSGGGSTHPRSVAAP
jgi:hypothetical protein